MSMERILLGELCMLRCFFGLRAIRHSMSDDEPIRVKPCDDMEVVDIAERLEIMSLVVWWLPC